MLPTGLCKYPRSDYAAMNGIETAQGNGKSTLKSVPDIVMPSTSTLSIWLLISISVYIGIIVISGHFIKLNSVMILNPNEDGVFSIPEQWHSLQLQYKQGESWLDLATPIAELKANGSITMRCEARSLWTTLFEGKPH